MLRVFNLLAFVSTARQEAYSKASLSEAYCQTSKMRFFPKIGTSLKLLTIFAKRSILDF